MSGHHAGPHGRMDHSATLGEVQSLNGYETYLSGKTHGELMPTVEGLPEQGLVHSFGNTDGGNYFDHNTRTNYLDGNVWEKDCPYYKTDVALEFLGLHQVEQPFFLDIASFAALLDLKFPENEAVDSRNNLAAFLGKDPVGLEYMLEEHKVPAHETWGVEVHCCDV